jgi:hypothetical protein
MYQKLNLEINKDYLVIGYSTDENYYPVETPTGGIEHLFQYQYTFICKYKDRELLHTYRTGKPDKEFLDNCLTSICNHSVILSGYSDNKYTTTQKILKTNKKYTKKYGRKQ